VKYRIAVNIQVLQLAKGQQDLHHLDVALLDGQLEGRHEGGSIRLIHALQHLGIADVIHQVEVGNQVGQRPGGIFGQSIAGLLQAIYIVVLKKDIWC